LFEAAMRGRAQAAQRDMDAQVALAWQTAAFTRAAKLKPLKHYLAASRPKSTFQSGDEILAVVKALKAGGADMTIRRVKRKSKE
jgi:hypothetical protein